MSRFPSPKLRTTQTQFAGSSLSRDPSVRSKSPEEWLDFKKYRAVTRKYKNFGISNSQSFSGMIQHSTSNPNLNFNTLTRQSAQAVTQKQKQNILNEQENSQLPPIFVMVERPTDSLILKRSTSSRGLYKPFFPSKSPQRNQE